MRRRVVLGLARLEARVGLVDHVDAALAADDAAILVAQLHRLERMTDLHGPYSTKSPGRAGVNSESARKIRVERRPVNPCSHGEIINDFKRLAVGEGGL